MEKKLEKIFGSENHPDISRNVMVSPEKSNLPQTCLGKVFKIVNL